MKTRDYEQFSLAQNWKQQFSLDYDWKLSAVQFRLRLETEDSLRLETEISMTASDINGQQWHDISSYIKEGRLTIPYLGKTEVVS